MELETIGRAAGAVGIMIALDVVAGITAAASRGDIQSSKLREGLMHKVALVLAFSLGVALEYAEGVLPLGMDVPLVVPVASYIILMEACSTYENVRRINPEFKFDGFGALFNDDEKEDS